MLMALVLMMLPGPVRGQDRYVSAGAYFSPKGVGFSVLFPSGWEGSQIETRMIADLSGVIGGKSSVPGGKAAILYQFLIAGATLSDGTVFQFCGGPGAMAGWLRDDDGEYGLSLALSGYAGIRFIFRVPLVLSFGASLDLGIHNSFRGGLDNEISMYMNGLKGGFMPELTLTYRFR